MGTRNSIDLPGSLNTETIPVILAISRTDGAGYWILIALSCCLSVRDVGPYLSNRVQHASQQAGQLAYTYTVRLRIQRVFAP